MLDHSDLRKSQLKQIEIMDEFEGGIVVLGCGGGKTAACLTAVAGLVEGGIIDHAVVLAPPMVLATAWPKEPEKWGHLQDVKIVTLSGTPEYRARMLRAAPKGSVITCSHENGSWLLKTMEQFEWNFDRTMLIIDEISKYKDPASKRRKTLLQYAPKFNSVFGLTGTPRPNGYEDLFVPIKLVAGADAWGITEFDKWRETFFVKQDYHGYKYEPNPLLVDRLDAVAQRYMFSLNSEEIGTAGLLEGEAFDRWVNLTDEQEGAYDKMYEEMILALGDDAENPEAIIEACSQGVASGKMTQIVQGFLYKETGDAVDVFNFPDNPKIAALMDLLEEIGDDPVAICYHYKHERAMLMAALGRAGHIGSGMSRSDIADTIARWQRGEIKRLLIHPQSVGHGTDGLQLGGHHLIWFHPVWSPEIYEQTIKRFDRPGQTHPVRNWRILARCLTDEVKDARVHNKLLDAAEFVAKLKK